MMLLMADRWMMGLTHPMLAVLDLTVCVFCVALLWKKDLNLQKRTLVMMSMMVEVDGSRCAETYCSG